MSTSASVQAESFADDVVAMLRAYCAERLDSREIDSTGVIPASLLNEMAELGIFGLSIPESHGGLGLGLAAVCRAVAAIAEHDRSVATTVGLHLGLGTRGMIAFGSDELRARYLPDLAAGLRIAAFAATEPGAGSDLQAIATRATVEGSAMRVRGTKIYVTNGGFASVFTILASSPGLAGRRRGHSLLALERGDDGLQIGAEEHKLGLRGSSTTSLFLDDVEVDTGRIIGDPGEGMEHVRHVLAWGRTVMAAGCTGSSRAALKKAVAHTLGRRQFGKPLARLPVVRQQIAELAALQFAMEALVLATGSTLDPRTLNRRSTATKVFCSDGNWEICDRAVQLHGGLGFIEESGLPLLLRDARVTRIFEGANDVLLVHLGAMDAVSGGARESLGALDAVGRAADALAGRVDAWRTELARDLGLKLLRRQELLHRLGGLAMLCEASDAVVARARGLGSVEALELAAHWLEIADRRARAWLDDPGGGRRAENIALRCAQSEGRA